MTNLKTTIDSNITKTINNQNLKEKDNKMSNKDNSSLIDSKSITFLSSSPIEMRSINPNSQIKNNNNQNNMDINTYKLIKRPKLKIPRSKSSIYKNVKIKKLSKYLSLNQNKIYNENSNINNNNIHANNSNKTFAFPNRINILIGLKQNLLTPMRKKNEIKFRNSISLNKKINKIEESIHSINEKQKTIDNNKILIKKLKLKNIYMLLEKQKESNNYKNKIEKENEEIEKIKEKIKKLKDKTVLMNNETMGFKTEIIENKAEISEIKEKIEKIINDKKMANSMIILLHRRIIDVKKRINEYNERNQYLDKTFYELGVKYQQDGNNINMSSFEK
jgi:DNA repair exonuclease SbcCD ATPase subunit